MKIALVTVSFPPQKNGLARAAASQALALQSLGHQVTVFCPQTELDLPTGVFSYSLKPKLRYGHGSYNPQLKKKLAGFDLGIQHYPAFGLAEVSVFAKVPVVLYYHMDLVGQGLFKGFFKHYQTKILPRLVSPVKKVLVSSQAYLENSYLAPLYLKNPAKFQVLPLSVDIGKFKPAPKDLKLTRQLGLGHQEKVILTVARLDKAHYFKGIDYLIDAVSLLRGCNFKLIIVGDGNLKPVLAQQVADLKLAHKVIFSGQVTDAELVKYYQLADFFVLPSLDKSEALGLVLLEAMATGLPVITSDLAGPKSLVKPNQTGLITRPGQVEDLVRAIKVFLNDPQAEDRSKMVRAEVVSAFSETVERQNWSDFLQSLV